MHIYYMLTLRFICIICKTRRTDSESQSGVSCGVKRGRQAIAYTMYVCMYVCACVCGSSYVHTKTRLWKCSEKRVGCEGKQTTNGARNRLRCFVGCHDEGAQGIRRRKGKGVRALWLQLFWHVWKFLETNVIKTTRNTHTHMHAHSAAHTPKVLGFFISCELKVYACVCVVFAFGLFAGIFACWPALKMALMKEFWFYSKLVSCFHLIF